MTPINDDDDCEDKPLLNSTNHNDALKETLLGERQLERKPLISTSNENNILRELSADHNHMSEEHSHSSNEGELSEYPSYNIVIYKRRWLTLFIFSMNTMMNGLLFMSLSSNQQHRRKVLPSAARLYRMVIQHVYVDIYRLSFTIFVFNVKMGCETSHYDCFLSPFYISLFSLRRLP